MAQHRHGCRCVGRVRELVAKPELCLADRRGDRLERCAGETEMPETAVEQPGRFVLAVRENVAREQAPQLVEDRFRERIGILDFTGLIQEAEQASTVGLRQVSHALKIRRTAYRLNAPSGRRLSRIGRGGVYVKTVVIALALGILATAAPAAASRGRAAGTLQLADVNLKGAYVGADCPQGTPDGDLCWTISTKGVVRGLGTVSESGVLAVSGSHTECEVWQSTPVLTVAGKGTIELSVKNPPGVCFNGATGAPVNPALVFTVTGGTGAYAGASGNGTLDTVGVAYLQASDMLDGTIVAPATTFDLTPPAFTGASAKIVRVPKGKRSVHVRYAVSANDSVDGAVPATCTPASGTSFRIGHTRVTCTASDSSDNTATKSFTIIVKRCPQTTRIGRLATRDVPIERRVSAHAATSSAKPVPLWVQCSW